MECGGITRMAGRVRRGILVILLRAGAARRFDCLGKKRYFDNFISQFLAGTLC